jgi:uncharacterized DUF497 family protein
MTREPSGGEAWEWDEGNEGELSRHGISPEEVYEVWENGPVWVPNVRHRAGDWKMLGRTNGGRPLTIVIRFYPDRGMLRVITGWNTTTGERSRYLKGR